MSTDRHPKRKRGIDTSIDDVLAADSERTRTNMSERPMDYSMQEQSINKRPRRSKANYESNGLYCVTKRKNTAPVPVSETPRKSKKGFSKRSTSVESAKMQGESGEFSEVQALISGQTSINEMRLEERPRSRFPGMQTLTRSMSMLGNNTSRLRHKIMDFFDIFRPDTTPHISENPIATPPSPAVQAPTHNRPPDSFAPADTLEGRLSSNHISVHIMDGNDDRLKNDDGEQEIERNSIGPYPPGRREASPPLLHGYPMTVQPYQPNVPHLNAFRRDGSALVKHQKTGQQHSAHVIWDTGSDPNFISMAKACELGCSIHELPKNEWRMIEGVNSDRAATQYVQLDMTIQNVGFSKDKVYLLVAKSKNFEIILGQDFIGQYDIMEKLVAKGPHGERAYAIISNKATPEQIQVIAANRERDARRARQAEANIQNQVSAERKTQQGISNNAASPSSTGNTSGGVYGGGPRTTVNTNSSFGPAMGQSRNSLSQSQRLSSTSDSLGGSSIDSSWFQQSFDQSTAATSFSESPSTTFSIPNTTQSPNSSFELAPMKRVGDKLKVLRKSKGKEGGVGASKEHGC